ncbi:LA2681 family HEPN domain-containing protein [Clostridium aminobutyricum]|uniref:LA2681-like HEPN domain-containing protein n=1 Tax=Clostridium aminobutyricum TaxID=33953 RepID=A0A939D993_CLOAM|nr:LA2681 family HEPN domain-containing protein [Clostridium aminobutyricum]MBN7773552.1 hypothetical protein [Clostridium aminobutyricum]
MMKIIDDNPYIEESVKAIARHFDHYYIEKDIAQIRKSIDSAKDLISNLDTDISKIHIYYSIATAYGDILHINPEGYSEAIIIEQLYNFRMAIDIFDSCNFTNDEMKYVTGCLIQIFTNYANALSSAGRIIEAIKYYKKALEIQSDFGMAEGNLGICYISYAELDFDNGHSQIFHYCAYKYLKTAISHKDTIVEHNAIAFFQDQIGLFSTKYIEEFLERKLKINKYSLGEQEESNYRNWVMKNGLFLNTMNDLPFVESFIATDSLQLPSIIRKTTEGINYKYHGLFNQIKQEFITARYLIFEALQGGSNTHFADKDIHLINTLDYTIHSIRIEKMKLAFRTLYSLYDKIAYFINDYFELGIQSRNVSYNRIWQNDSKQILLSKSNWMLNGLYWISKEFFERGNTSYNTIKPRAKLIYDIRQALEHRYMKVTEYDIENSRKDSLALYVPYKDFKQETLELTWLVRESIIYLSLAVHLNENLKRSKLPNAVYPNIPLFEFDDEWKL